MAIGFIGLGNIGMPMARHLLKLDEAVWVYDVFAERVQQLVEVGAHAAKTPGELAARCRYIGLCVRDEDDVDNLLQGADGLLARAAKDTVIAVHSTVTQAAVLRWQREAGERGLQLLDAPMTGGAGGAESASLCYMVGGAPALIEHCRPIWATSAGRIVHAGPVGAAIALKLCNNLMSYAAFTAIHEATKLAAACGLPVAVLSEVGEANGVVTPQMKAFLNNRSALEQRGEAALRAGMGPHGALGRKDLEAALKCAEQWQLQLPATRLNQDLIEDVFLNRY
jgi:3-hydroxyisobutyrate dehydrogenase-like beta-hydroxyacid dehydrogenase